MVMMSEKEALEFIAKQLEGMVLIVGDIKQSLDRIENKINESKGWR